MDQECRKRGIVSRAAFIRAAIENELRGPSAQLTDTEHRLFATLDRMDAQHRTADQALFALLANIAKVLLVRLQRVPEDAKPAAIAASRQDYDQLLKRTGMDMAGDAGAMLAAIVGGSNGNGRHDED